MRVALGNRKIQNVCQSVFRLSFYSNHNTQKPMLGSIHHKTWATNNTPALLQPGQQGKIGDKNKTENWTPLKQASVFPRLGKSKNTLSS